MEISGKVLNTIVYQVKTSQKFSKCWIEQDHYDRRKRGL